MGEIQYLEVSANGPFEQTKIEIENLDEGTFKMIYFHPTDLEVDPWATEDISVMASANQVKNAVKWWYSNKFGSGITVDKEHFDADGVLITSEDDEVIESTTAKVVYTITLKKYITAKTATSITVMKSNSAATINILYPDDVQLSGAPLSGSLMIECVDKDGFIDMSDEMSSTTNAWSIRWKLEESCFGLRDKIEVMEVDTFPYKANGRSIYILFRGATGDMGQFRFVSGEDTPLEGDEIQFHQNVTQPYGTNLLYEPIPFEWLRAYEETPQVLVSVNGTPAACSNLNCGYVYMDPVGELTEFSFDVDTKLLTMTGTNLPKDSGELRDIKFAKSPCLEEGMTFESVVVDEETTTDTITCTLAREETCGMHVPTITAVEGIVPGAPDLAAIQVDCTINEVWP
jgi:hypothetical protein